MITSHRNQLRRWATGMLLVWVFGVFAGVANACALGSVLEHASDPAAVEHHSSSSQHGAEDKADMENCQQFCDLSSSAVPSQPAAPDQVALAAIPVAFAIIGAPAATPLLLQPVRSPLRNSGPPIPIAFLRLTL
jgi:hypothetical protein